MEKPCFWIQVQTLKLLKVNQEQNTRLMMKLMMMMMMVVLQVNGRPIQCPREISIRISQSHQTVLQCLND